MVFDDVLKLKIYKDLEEFIWSSKVNLVPPYYSFKDENGKRTFVFEKQKLRKWLSEHLLETHYSEYNSERKLNRINAEVFK